MNSRNMEQLIEKYKREMLSYSMRSSAPPTPAAPVEQTKAVTPAPAAPVEHTKSVTPAPAAPDEQTKAVAPSPAAPDEQSKAEAPRPKDPAAEDIVEQRAPKQEKSEEDAAPVSDYEDPGEAVLVMANVSKSNEDPSQDDMETLDEPAREAVAAINRESRGGEVPDDSNPLNDLVDSKEELRLSLLRESCRKIAAGEATGSDEQKQSCTELYNFFAVNTALGSISVEAYASDQAFGVGSARVMIFIPLKSGNIVVFDGLTNINGATAKISLPAPPKELSLSPDEKALPYSLYTILVEHPNYVREVFYDVPVFDGIESIQPAIMQAKVDNDKDSTSVVVDEIESIDLK